MTWLSRAASWFPWTPFGLAVGVAASAGGLGFALPESDYVLQVLCGTAVALVVLQGAVVVGAATWARRQLARQTRPEVAGEAERGAVTALELPRAFWVELDVAWGRPRGPRATLELDGDGLRERVRFGRRQWTDAVERRWRIEDPFGLARVAWAEVQPQRVRVAPWRGALDRCPELRAFAPGEALPHPLGWPEGDRVDLRRYQPGDPIRLIAWKTYARTGELDVRMPERALAPERRTAAYLVTGPHDEPPAAAAWVAIERGALGPNWVFGTDGSEAIDEPRAALDAILRSSRAEAAPAAGIATFLAEARRRGPTQLLVFVPGRPGPWLDRCAAVAGPDMLAVIVVDGVGPQPVARRWWRAPEAARPAEGRVRVTAKDVDAVRSALEGRGAAAVVLSREQGRALEATGARRRVA